MEEKKANNITKNKIIDSFWDLIKSVGFEKTTVTDICKKANINRTTFYNYFFDIYDLTDQIESDLIAQLKKEVTQRFSKIENRDINLVSTFFTEIFLQFNDKIFTLLKSKGDPAFFSKVRNEMVPLACSLNILDKNIPNFEYLVTFIYSAVWGLVSHWHEDGQKLPVEDFTKMTQTLIATGAFGITQHGNN